MIWLVRIPFLDRAGELRRLSRFLSGDHGNLGVIYGRRRCGKSTLMHQVRGQDDVYFLADQRAARLQIQTLAVEAGRVVPELAAASYASWDALLGTLDARVGRRLNLAIDEFPYLVGVSPELPSLIQRYLDQPGSKKLRFLLCGSSQRMMQGLVLDRTAPLYGRAQEILKIEPLRPGWISTALGVQGDAAIAAYAVWGGVPRYWELAREHASLEQAVRDLVLDRHGVLHDEPAGLLLDDLRTAGQAYSLLSLVGAGCNRLSEIAARLGKPAGSLTRPLSNLIDLGYIRKDVPFGESDRSSKRTLYRVSDPFLSFFFRFLQPSRSLLELGLVAPVQARIKEELPAHVAGVWENLARQSVPFLRLGGIEWGPAARWWGAGAHGGLELDVVAESLDRRRVLIGEAKWSERRPDVRRWGAQLRARAAGAPFVRDREVVYALWLRQGATPGSGPEAVVTPDAVLGALR
ncbi:MAG: ATP-binding protein [Deltaproteobacteria bacterium]|nr:ATP-binding protein [Deltaproteobacteria bacterium]